MAAPTGPLPGAGEVLVTRLPLSLDRALAAVGGPVGPIPGPVGDPETGAIVTFTGIVCGQQDGKPLPAVDFEHYEGMAQGQMQRLMEEAALRWPIIAAALHHRVGPVPAGEACVLVAVAATHREEAFDAARFLIEELKVRVPIWRTAPSP